MTTIKKFFALALFVAVAAVSSSNTANAQTGNPTEEFVIQAHETEVAIGMLLPAVQKVREAAARNLVLVLKNTQDLAVKVQRAGKNMSSREYEMFQRQLAVQEAALDKANGAGNPTAGNPQPGTVGACHKSCHDAF